MAQLNVYKVTSLPGSPNPDSIYLVKGILDTEVSMFVTDNAGTARPLSSTPLRTAGDIGIGSVRYAGITRTDGQFYGGGTNPTSSTRLNYDGNLTARFISAGAISSYSSKQTTVQTTAVTVTDDATLSSALHLVYGENSNNLYTDLVLQLNNNVTVVSSVTQGSPVARTYGVNAVGFLTLRMASGTYETLVSTIRNQGLIF